MSLKMGSHGSAVEEMFHGVTVLDPYRWLEDGTSSQTAAWIAAQHEICRDFFSRCTGLERIRTRVRESLEVEVLDQVARTGARLFHHRRDRVQEQACHLCQGEWSQ
jgi:prolyl oligopeptidase